MAKKIYAVKNGRKTGLFETWTECEASVKSYPGALYKSFTTKEAALEYLNGTETSVKEKKTEKITVPNGVLVAYVDGSYNKEKQIYGSGVVLFFKDESKEIYEAGDDEVMLKMWNVAGEVNAAMLAIEYGIENGFEKVIIHHDYTGIAGWANGWKANEEGSKVYKEYIEEAKEKIKIEFVKVKAHSKNELNDLADALAKKACGINE